MSRHGDHKSIVLELTSAADDLRSGDYDEEINWQQQRDQSIHHSFWLILSVVSCS